MKKRSYIHEQNLFTGSLINLGNVSQCKLSRLASESAALLHFLLVCYLAVGTLRSRQRNPSLFLRQLHPGQLISRMIRLGHWVIIIHEFDTQKRSFTLSLASEQF
jgi:hypothetical protein